MIKELSNPASREGYADPADGQREYPVDRPGRITVEPNGTVTTQYHLTPGPGPSAGIPKRDLELSKIEKQVEDIRLVLKREPLISSSSNGASIKFALTQIELSTGYLKGHA